MIDVKWRSEHAGSGDHAWVSRRPQGPRIGCDASRPFVRRGQAV